MDAASRGRARRQLARPQLARRGRAAEGRFRPDAEDAGSARAHALRMESAQDPYRGAKPSSHRGRHRPRARVMAVRPMAEAASPAVVPAAWSGAVNPRASRSARGSAATSPAGRREAEEGELSWVRAGRSRGVGTIPEAHARWSARPHVVEVERLRPSHPERKAHTCVSSSPRLSRSRSSCSAAARPRRGVRAPQVARTSRSSSSAPSRAAASSRAPMPARPTRTASLPTAATQRRASRERAHRAVRR
jgi:hypothetical protein